MDAHTAHSDIAAELEALVEQIVERAGELPALEYRVWLARRRRHRDPPQQHVGIHGDYRFTFLDFNRDRQDEGFIRGLLPGHRGSMWTLGATVYS